MRDHNQTKKYYFYEAVVRPAIISECRVVDRDIVQRMDVAKMMMLRWMCGATKENKIRN